MFVFELMTWLALSFALVMLHIRMTSGPHERRGVTIATAMMWGTMGGLLGTVIRQQISIPGGYNLSSLGLAGLGTVAFLLLEWLGSAQHAVRH